MTNKDSLFIFSHVRKCAGTSITSGIKKAYDDDEWIHVHFDEYGKNKSSIPGITDREKLDRHLTGISTSNKKKVKFIFGHDVYLGIHHHFEKRRPYYFTFLRHPVSRIKSIYNFAISQIISGYDDEWLGRWMTDDNGNPYEFREWVDRLPSQYNPLMEHFRQCDYSVKGKEGTDQVLQTLRKFDFVGFVEDQSDFVQLFQILNIKESVPIVNLSYNHIAENSIDSELLSVISTKVKEDIELYEAAREMLAGNKVLQPAVNS